MRGGTIGVWGLMAWLKGIHAWHGYYLNHSSGPGICMPSFTYASNTACFCFLPLARAVERSYGRGEGYRAVHPGREEL